MTSASVVVVVQGEVRTAWPTAPDDANVLALLCRHGVALDAACGGAGTCGACAVRVLAGRCAPPDAVEHALLGPARLAAGERLACRLAPGPGLQIALPSARAGGARHKESLLAVEPATDAAPDAAPDSGPDQARAADGDPRLRWRRLELVPPTLADPTPDLERLLRAAGCDEHRLSLAALHALPSTLRLAQWRVDLLEEAALPGRRSPRLLDVVPAPRDRAAAAGAATVVAERSGPWGLAVDLGTTTVAAYLLDLGRARAVDVLAAPNRQAPLGADVLSRIAATSEHGTATLQRLVATQLAELAAALAARNELTPRDLVDVTVVGNTTMLHLLFGLDPAPMGETPFVPTSVAPLVAAAAEVGLGLHPAARVRTLPAVSAYLGADAVAAVLAAGLDADGAPALLVDLGTNGEIVLRHPGGLLACSTAAGPAFEGAGIRCGVAGVDGAVAAFAWPAGAPAPQVATIGDAPAVGLCGAGLIAVVAALLEHGAIAADGRLPPPEELPAALAEAVRARCRRVDGRPGFEVVPAGGSADGVAIVLTDGDVRALQLAKAAIAAGIDTLLADAGVAVDAVERVVLTGGFGAFLDPLAAVRVGLLPARLQGRTDVLANAAGVGAVMAATSLGHAQRCLAIASRVRVLELSASIAFTDAYVDHLAFGAR